jgi:hypothetical protein
MWTWLQHPETHNKARFSAESAPFWRAQGWADCEPDPDPDLTQDHGDLPAPAARKPTTRSAGRGGTTAEGSD